MQIARDFLDRIVFSATTDSIDPEDRVREVVAFDSKNGAGEFELWGHRHKDSTRSGDENRWVILKFPGTGGRAERASTHPAGALPDGSVEAVWAVNPPGYGTSPGRASLATMPDVIVAAIEKVRALHPDSRLLVTGNSLGCAWALFAAANYKVDMVVLRNPFCLKQLIRERWRYNWWNLGAVRLLVRSIPDALDTVANARRCKMPAMIVQSARDSVIPVKFQNRVIEALAGPKELLVIPGADHGDPLPESLEQSYLEKFQRLFAGI